VVLARAFYAGQETRIPVAAALLAVAVNVVVSIATVGSLGSPVWPSGSRWGPGSRRLF